MFIKDGEEFGGINITSDIKKMAEKLEQLGKENDYTLWVEHDELEKFKYLIENLFNL